MSALSMLQPPSTEPKSDNPGKDKFISRLQDEIPAIKKHLASNIEYNSRTIEIHKPSNKIAITIKFIVGSQHVIIIKPETNYLELPRAKFNKFKGTTTMDKAVSYIEALIKDLSEETPYDQAFKDAQAKIDAILDHARSKK